MNAGKRFRRILPASQVAIAALFGIWGLWQRNQILSHDYLFGIGWNTADRAHVWPWPYKFSVVSNFPAFIAGAWLSAPFEIVWPTLSEYVEIVPSLLVVPLLWYWVGSRLDRRWGVTDRTPWITLGAFTLICLTGALLPIGYVGFLLYGFVLWAITILALSRHTRTCTGFRHQTPTTVNE
jgi:hypothetical protein